jgi:hypothetical protein
VRSTLCRRTNASCTTSSASVGVPSIRYASPKSRDR